MLRSYEAYYENGELKWIGDKPPEESARVIVTFVSEQEKTCPSTPRPSQSIAYKGKIHGDIMSPVTEDEDWEVLK